MGIILNRRRACGGKKEDTYIQDGLVFWLDGINKGNDPTAWTDLVNGISFLYNNTTVYDDSISMSKYLIGSGKIDVPKQICQIEVLCSSVKTTQVVFCPADINNISFGFYKTNQIITNYYYGSNPVENGVVASYSIGGKKTIINGESLYTNNSTNYFNNANSSGKFLLGAINNFATFSGRLYSIRIYNRHLTDNEVFYNYNLDKQRFNL